MKLGPMSSRFSLSDPARSFLPPVRASAIENHKMCAEALDGILARLGALFQEALSQDWCDRFGMKGLGFTAYLILSKNYVACLYIVMSKKLRKNPS